MSASHPTAVDSPRIPESQASQTATGTPAHLAQQPRPHTVISSPRFSQSTGAFTPANMPPVEVLSRPALSTSATELPWQRRPDERLPSMRSLVQLPPLEPPAIPHPPPATTATQTTASRHSWPLPAPPQSTSSSMPPLFAAGPLPSIPEHHLGHRVEHVAAVPARPPHPRPQSLNAVSPVTYITSPGGYPLQSEATARLSPDERAPRRLSPSQHMLSQSVSRGFAEMQHRRDGPAPGQARRVIRTEFLPERGWCYVYDDGTVCEMSVGGETVNPEWGLTRAGRPRKRLAKACISCREKKVRCEPGETRCVRCARQGEECRWADERDNQSTEEGAAADSRSGFEIPTASGPGVPLTPPYSLQSRRPYDPLTDSLEDQRPAKRLRTQSPPRSHKTESAEDIRRDFRGKDSFSQRGRSNEREYDRRYDPFRTDSTGAARLMNLYFLSPYCCANTIIPQEHLLRYAKTGDKVSTMERLFICTTIALGSLFSQEQSLRVLGNQAANWAYTVEREACFTLANLAVILARLNLALYYFAIEERSLSANFLSVALADLKRLRLGIEGGAETLTASSQDTYSSLGLPLEERIEALRRTFWLGFLVERLCTSPAESNTFQLLAEDTFLRLPSADRFYQAPHPTPSPLHDGGILAFNSQRPEEIGTTSHLILITSVLSTILAFNDRALHRRTLTTYAPDYAGTPAAPGFYNSIIQRFADWESALPPYLRQTAENTMLHIARGEMLAPYLAIHTVFHTAAIHLHRYVRHALLPAEIVRRNIAQATAHAVCLLDLFAAVVRSPSFAALGNPSAAAATSITTAEPSQPQQQPPPHEHPLALPLLSHAALLAADTVSCAGTVDRHLPAVLHLLQGAHALVVEQSRWFGPARAAEGEIARRIGHIRGMRAGGTWRLERALGVGAMAGGGAGDPRDVPGEGVVPKEFDVCYGVEQWTLQKSRGDFVVSQEPPPLSTTTGR